MTTPALEDLTNEAANVAAKWWADHLRNHTPSVSGNPIANAAKAIALKDVVIDPEKIDAFEKALTAEILSEMHWDGEKRQARCEDRQPARIGTQQAHTRVDYGPCRTLIAAIAAVGEKASGCADNKSNSIAGQLPWKTDLYITPLGVRVGFGGEWLYKTFEEVPLAGPGTTLRVVDRWLGPRRHERCGRWTLDDECWRGRERDVAFVALGQSVEPKPIAYVLRGRVDVEGYCDAVEDDLASAFANTFGRGGYLALVAPFPEIRLGRAS